MLKKSLQSYKNLLKFTYFCIEKITMNTREAKIEAFGHLLDVQERLRKECPWDRKQTFQSLRPNTIEETFELADALMNNDMHNVKIVSFDRLEDNIRKLILHHSW